MTEQVWRHRFIATLVAIIRKDTGLGESMAFELAFQDVDRYWQQMSSFDTPEQATEDALKVMKQ